MGSLVRSSTASELDLSLSPRFCFFFLGWVRREATFVLYRHPYHPSLLPSSLPTSFVSSLRVRGHTLHLGQAQPERTDGRSHKAKQESNGQDKTRHDKTRTN
mmetsp:Transcript_39548/g.77848  ORF Transcript_39548/g.77848 Transcript_39548/m.77848 type:complete len:102 (-) Transcript_39548:112-417(-)